MLGMVPNFNVLQLDASPSGLVGDQLSILEYN